MEAATWILVINIFAFAVGESNESSRTRDLQHDACLTLVQEVKSERTIASATARATRILATAAGPGAGGIVCI
jgi:hypothetical protein